MNTKMKCLLVVAAAAFMSCSSDNAATAPEQVATFADLGECNSLSEGVTKQVAADGLYYKCVAGGWQETEWVPDNSGTLAGSVLLDSRDGHTYKTVTIGTQTWMAENLNYKMDEAVCPGDEYCKTHKCHDYDGIEAEDPYDHCSPIPDTTIWPDAGCYYRSNSALSACPSGWHLPSLDEWKILFEAVGGTDVAAKMLKASSGFCGDDGRNSNGTDAYGFNARSTGACSLLEWNYYHSRCYNKTGNGRCIVSDKDILYVPDQNDYIIGGAFPHCNLGGGAAYWTSTYLGRVPCTKKFGSFLCQSTEIDVYSFVSFDTGWHSDAPDDVDFPTPDPDDYDHNWGLRDQLVRLYSVRCVKD